MRQPWILNDPRLPAEILREERNTARDLHGIIRAFWMGVGFGIVFAIAAALVIFGK